MPIILSAKLVIRDKVHHNQPLTYKLVTLSLYCVGYVGNVGFQQIMHTKG